MLRLSRRSFLQMSGATVAALITGCTRSGQSTTTATTGQSVTGTTAAGGSLSGDLPFSVWEEVRAAVRTSPDHLPARAADVVATGDPEAIFNFVRDHITVVPPRREGFAASVGGRLWGTRGTLRSGMGTPREQADLLAELYTQAGLTAEVVEGSLTGEWDAEAILARRGGLRFAPEVDAAVVASWHQALQIEQLTERVDPDPDGSEGAALADRLLTMLGSPVAGEPFDPSPPARIPLVKLTLSGAETLANPLFPNAVFGDGRAESVTVTSPGISLGEVRMALSVARSTNPGERITIAQGSWPTEDVIGRMLVARFMPAPDPTAYFTVPVDQIHSYVPFLGLDGVDLDPQRMEETAVVGDAITVFGEKLVTDGTSSTVSIEGESIGGDPNATARVAAIAPSVAAAAFPSIFLTVGVTDRAGAAVVDLPASAFTVTEEGSTIPFLLTASHAPTPKVLMLFDGSSSLPADFIDSGAVQLARQIAEEILAGQPDAQFRLAGINFGTASVSPVWMTTAAEVETEAGRLITDGSELWTALADARSVDANVIVLVTDAQATDTPEQIAVARPWVAGGPPVIVVGVGEYDASMGADLATASGGAAVPAADRTEAVAAVLGFLETLAASPYRIAYRAPADGPDVRRIRIAIGAVESNVEYEVPAVETRLTPPGLTGLYLTIAVASQEVTRTLAGIPVEEASNSSAVSSELLDEVRLALPGAVAISIEPGPPLASVWFDDFLTGKLSIRPLYEAPKDDLAMQLEALKEGVHHLPPNLLALHGPLAPGGQATYPTGPRSVLMASRRLPSGDVVRRVDLLPFNGWSTAADPTSAFRTTAEKSARMAIVEAELFSDSTLSRLTARTLAYLPPATPAAREGPAAPWARLIDSYGFYHRLIPGDDGPFAMWVIDQQGSVLGVLPDGSGGGSAIDDIGQQCKEVGQKAAALQLADPGFGLPYTAFVSLQKAISLQALRAAAIIATLESPQVPDACNKGLNDLACDWAKDTVAAKFSPYSPIDTADDVVEAAGGGGLVNC